MMAGWVFPFMALLKLARYWEDWKMLLSLHRMVSLLAKTDQKLFIWWFVIKK